METATEQWRYIPGFSRYKVSNLGRIASFDNGQLRRIISKTPNCRTGYYICRLRPDDSPKAKIKRTLRTATVIAAAWLPPRPSPLHQVHHKDHNKSNEVISNLEWVTQSENVLASYGTGERRNPSHFKFLTEADYDVIKALWRERKMSQCNIASVYGVTNSCISRVVNGKCSPVRRSRYLSERQERVNELVMENPGIGKVRIAQIIGVCQETAWHYLRRARKLVGGGGGVVAPMC